MRLDYQPEEHNAQTLHMDGTSTSQDSTVDLSEMQESANMEEPEALRRLLSVAEKEKAARRKIPFVALAYFLFVLTILFAFPHSSIASFCWVLMDFSLILVGLWFGAGFRRTTMALAEADDPR